MFSFLILVVFLGGLVYTNYLIILELQELKSLHLSIADSLQNLDLNVVSNSLNNVSSNTSEIRNSLDNVSSSTSKIYSILQYDLGPILGIGAAILVFLVVFQL